MKIIEWLNDWVGTTADKDMVNYHIGGEIIRRPKEEFLRIVNPVLLNWKLTKVHYIYRKRENRWHIHIYTNPTPNKLSYLDGDKWRK